MSTIARYTIYLCLMLIGLGNMPSFARSGQSERMDSLALSQQIEYLDSLWRVEPDSTLICSNELLKNLTIGHEQQAIWQIRTIQSRCFDTLGEKDSALAILKTIIQESKSQQDSLSQLSTLLVSAEIYQANYDHKNAITNLLAAQHLLTAQTPFDLRFDLFRILGQTHRNMKDYGSALQYFKLLEHDYYFQLDAKQRYLIYTSIGNLFFVQKDYEQTEEYYKKAYAETENLNELSSLISITYNLGNLYFRQKKFDQATNFIERALQANLKVNDKIRIEKSYRVLGAISYQQNNTRKAISYYTQALHVAEEINNPKSIVGNYQNLFQCYERIAEQSKRPEDFESAINYQKKMVELNDSLYQTDLANQLLELEKKYETDKKNAEIKLLSRENQIKADQLIIESQQRKYLLILLVVLLLIIATILYFVRYYRQLNNRLQSQGKLIFEQKERILTQNVQLQKAMDTQNRVYSIIGHDLRSPLVSVSNFVRLTEFFLRDGKIDKLKEMAKRMDKKNEQVLELTDNLLNWARSQSEGLKIQYDRISLNEVLDEVFTIYKAIASKKEVELYWDEQEDFQLWTDRDMVRTICRNLVSNALKFTPAGGTVTMKSTSLGDQAWISVTDTGIGMNSKQVDSLFITGKKEVRAGTEGEKSTGLGLSVVKEFCELLKCELKVDSQENQGSCFSFSVDLYTDDLRRLTEIRAKSLPSVTVISAPEETQEPATESF